MPSCEKYFRKRSVLPSGGLKSNINNKKIRWQVGVYIFGTPKNRVTRILCAQPPGIGRFWFFCFFGFFSPPGPFVFFFFSFFRCFFFFFFFRFRGGAPTRLPATPPVFVARIREMFFFFFFYTEREAGKKKKKGEHKLPRQFVFSCRGKPGPPRFFFRRGFFFLFQEERLLLTDHFVFFFFFFPFFFFFSFFCYSFFFSPLFVLHLF